MSEFLHRGRHRQHRDYEIEQRKKLGLFAVKVTLLKISQHLHLVDLFFSSGCAKQKTFLCARGRAVFTELVMTQTRPKKHSKNVQLDPFPCTLR